MSTITNPEHALTLGSINLIGTDAELVANGYTFEALGDDADWGNPVPIEVAVASWLQDGANISIERHENREMFIRVRVRGTSHDNLAIAEQALVLECGRPNLLIWTPPDGDAAPCVFEVATSTLDQVPDDHGDLRTEATYGMRIKAFPFVRAIDETMVSINAPSGTQSFTTVDDGTSTTNWALTNAGAGATTGPSVSGGGVLAGVNAGGGLVSFTLRRSGLSVVMSSTPYLRVEAAIVTSARVPFGVSFAINDVPTLPATQSGSVYWFDLTSLGSNPLTSLSFTRQGTVGSDTSSAAVTVHVLDVSRSNVLGDATTTTRELARTLPVLGSARTQGTIDLSDASNALGDVLVHTMPTISGLIQPNLRAWLTSGNSPTTDGTLVSGTRTGLSTLHTFDAPASGVLPGTYALMARIRHSSSGERVLTWAARSRMGSNNLTGSQSGTTTVSLTANVWQIVDIARLTLPTVRVGSDGLVRIELTGTSNMDLDEAWLFNLDDGHLTWIDCGTATPAAGGAANRLWIDCPTPDEPTYQYFTGTEADRSDSFYATTVKSEGHHELVPSSVNVFTVTPNSTASVLGFRYYRRGHTRIVNV